MLTVYVPAGGARLAGELTAPSDALGLVLFAHGSGSSRFSRRNQFVARVLESHRFATLLIDLLTPEEETLDQRTGIFASTSRCSPAGSSPSSTG